jgi:hypothetical protein
MKNRNAAISQERIDTLKLVVDQAFEWCDIQNLHGFRIRAFDFRDDGEKGGFCFTGGGIGGKNEIVVCIKNDLGGGDLYGTKGFPSACVDEILHKGREAVKDIGAAHGVLLSGKRKHPARAEIGQRKDVLVFIL